MTPTQDGEDSWSATLGTRKRDLPQPRMEMLTPASFGLSLHSVQDGKADMLTLFLIFLRIFFRAFSSDFVRGSLVGMG